MTTVMKSWRCTVQKNFLHHPVHSRFYIFIFIEKYFLLMDRMQIFAFSLLIIEFIEILVKLKNIAHAISVE